jgi:putative DNA primase/helicase
MARKKPAIDTLALEILRNSKPSSSSAPDLLHFKEPLTGVPDLLRFLPNDNGNAERLIALFGHDLRYCPPMRKWLVWDGKRWKADATGEIFRRAKAAMREFLEQAMDIEDDDRTFHFAVGSLNERRLSRLVTLAESEIYIEPHDLDTHPKLLNVLNGTIELDTGELRPHRREDFLTKLVHVEYDPAAKCPRWHKFLGEVLEPDLHDYVQRALGYSLTGTTIEKSVFAVYGPGNSGKTTLLTTFRELIPEYSVVIQADTLMSRAHDTNNTQADLCDLRGARFVHTSECEASQRLSQSRLKAITQGAGYIKATRKYENPITFSETHKLWLDTNERPAIKNVDDQATFNRLHPIPFLRVIPKEEVDPGLGEKLKAEYPGVLAWAVAGARAWRARGLDKPPEVQMATEDWRAENDNIGTFIEECCVTGNGFSARARAIYAEYQQWVERSGEKITASNREFSLRLVARGFLKRHTEKGDVYDGLGLRAEGN